MDEDNWLTQGPDHQPAALITGGSVGLGLAMARDLVRSGWLVFVCARTQADLDEAVTLEPALRPIRADVALAADRARVMATVDEVTGGRPLDLLVNNAAIVRAHDYTNPFTLGADRAADEIAINFAAPVELCRLFLASRMGRAAGPGAILNVSTPGAFFPLDANPLYCATKAGFHMFTLSLRRHLAATPVRVFEVYPPALDTRLADALDVASQAANGQDAIDAVAAETIRALLAGEEVIAPHKQSRALLAMFPQMDAAALDAVNRGVKRRAGWDRA